MEIESENENFIVSKETQVGAIPGPIGAGSPVHKESFFFPSSQLESDIATLSKTALQKKYTFEYNS